jgi:hypothetical protein
MDDQGRLTLKTTDCEGGLDHLEVKFAGGASWLYNIFSRIIAGSIKKTLNSMVHL